MPEMDAEAFLARCRGREPVARAIPVLLLSASSNLDRHAERLGVDAVVAKPFDIDALCTAVREVMTEDRNGRAVRGRG
jgi:CheY-like chemotaxis protein